METVAVFDEYHTEELHPTNKADEQKYHGSCNNSDSGSAINIIKSDLNEILDNQPTDNVNHGNISKTVLEKIPKIDTDERSIWSDSEGEGHDPDCDPFANVGYDSKFLSSEKLRTLLQGPRKSMETETDLSHLPSKNILPLPINVVVQNSLEFKFECKLCLKKLSSQKNLNSHVSICSTTHKEKHLYCVECNKKYAATDNFKTHNLNIHNRGIEAIKPEYYRVQFQCQFCPMKFVLKDRFKTHTQSHLTDLDTAKNKALQLHPYKCQECRSSSTFSTVEDLKNHMLKTHVEQVFKCPEQKCGKVFNNKGQLNWHFSSHSDNKPYKCRESNCGKSFKYKQSISRHMTSHSNNKLFICSEPNCGKTFRTKCDLEKHGELHNKNSASRDINRPFKCSECGKAFSKNWQVNAHVKIVHPKGEPLKCPHADCAKSFKHKDNLNCHLAHSHDDKYTLKCPHPGCNKTVKRKTGLEIHMRTHTGDRPFICTMVEGGGCSKTFIKAGDLKMHIREKHNKNVK